MEKVILKTEGVQGGDEMEPGIKQVVVEELNMPLEYSVPERSAAEVPCSCACWQEVTRLQETVDKQEQRIEKLISQVQDLNSAVVKLLAGSSLTAGKDNRMEDEVSIKSKACNKGLPPSTSNAVPSFVKNGRDEWVISSTAGAIVNSNGHTECSEETEVMATTPFREIGAPSTDAEAWITEDVALDETEEIETGTTDIFQADPLAEQQKPTVRKPAKSAAYRKHRSSSNHNDSVNIRVKCDQCAKTFLRMSFLKEHVRVIHEGFRYKCSRCPAKYSSNQDLQKHKYLHSSGRQLRTCELCGVKVLDSDKSMTCHMMVHNGANYLQKKVTCHTKTHNVKESDQPGNVKSEDFC